MPFPLPMVHMLVDVFKFLTNLISALYSDKISDLIRDLPNAKLALHISDNVASMTVEDFFKYQMSQPESPLKTQFNFILQVRMLRIRIQNQNESLIYLIIKQENDVFYNQLISIEEEQKAISKKQLDELAETERLAENKKLIENYMIQLNSYMDNHNRLIAIDSRLNYISNRQQEIYSKIEEQAEKNFTTTVDKYSHNQQILINGLTHQLHEIDAQINNQMTKLFMLENDLELLKARSAPENIIQEKSIEINNLKSMVSNLEDLRLDESNLLNKIKADVKSITELAESGLTSLGTPHEQNAAKLAAFQTVLQSKNQETLSMAKDIKDKINDFKKNHPALADKPLDFLTKHDLHEKVAVNANKFAKDCIDINKSIDALFKESASLEQERIALSKEQDERINTKKSLEEQLSRDMHHVQAAMREIGGHHAIDNLKEISNFDKNHSITTNPQKQADPQWKQTKCSEESYNQLLQKMDKKHHKDKDDGNPPKPQEPPRNGFHHK